MVQICIQYDFNDAQIMEHMQRFETDDKYKGIADFEWNTTQSRQQKQQELKRKAAYAER